MAFEIPLKLKDSQHMPMETGDLVTPSMIPLSSRARNELLVLSDGLYAGDSLGADTFYINFTTGTDDMQHGSKATPFKTLDYALTYLTSHSAAGVFDGKVTLAINAADTQTLTADFENYGDLTLAFYNSNYGDFDGVPIGTGASPANMSDLQRPVITAAILNEPAGWRIRNIRLHGKGRVKGLGVKFQLPTAPNPVPQLTAYANLNDMVVAMDESEGALILEGCVVNCQNTSSVFGILGVHARARVNFTQFATRFTVLDANVVSGASAVALLARNYFIKMYPDMAGNNQQSGVLVPASSTASTGSGLLYLTWTDTQALIVTGSTTNQATFPVAFDAAYGLRNYIYNLIKDQQSRALNIVSSRLI